MSTRLRMFCVLVFFCLPSTFGFAQQISLIAQPVVESDLTTLKGNTHPLAQPKFDIGIAPPDLPMNRMLLVLKRSPEQEHALETMLDNQQDKLSPQYHKWLTPDQFGTQFGPSDQDLQTVTNWLQSHGFQISRVSHGRGIIEFSGVESQVEEAFHTSIHKYVINGEEHWANASDPSIPTALVPAVAGFASLNNFPPRRFSHVAGVVSREKSNGRLTPAKPLFTLPQSNGCGVQTSDCYGVGPYDFATIYDVLPAWNASTPIDGTNQTIAIVGETDINPQDVSDFRSFFGLPTYGQSGGPTLNIIHNGPAPGILSDGEETEADLDVEWSGAVAKGASVDFVVSESTETTAGVALSALYIVDNNLSPVMSESYGECELFLGPSGNQFFSALWQQAAAQGITVMLSAGDGGSAGCDDFDTPGPATYGLQVSGYASTPYNVAVGGTDFNDLTDASTYWSATNNSTTQASALSYIPETTWDDNCTNPVFGALLGFSTNAETNCNNSQLINAGFVNIISGSGGKSSCTNSDGQNPSSCTAGYTKPSWQIAPGVPSDGVRDVPDISLYAASGSPSGSFYIVCEADAVDVGSTSCNTGDPSTEFLAVGGTSGSSPAFAGIMALVTQKTGEPQGNANFVLYKLAQQLPSTFHDVTTGTIAVPCQTGSPNCTTSRAGDQYGILSGYNTGTGYDLATGVGSVDVNNLLQNWSSAKFTATTTTLSLNPTSNLTHGQSVTVGGSVSPTSGSGVPTGRVSLLTSTGLAIDGFTLANGAIEGNTNLLPGGSYTVTAHYGGDPTFGGSSSSPVSVTVAKESSNLQLRLITFDFNGNETSTNATAAVYGSPYLLRVNVLNSSSAACQPAPLGESACPTGNVTLSDNGTALDGGTFDLNSLGYTEDQTIQLPGGSQTIDASYAGDNSFDSSSTSATYSITPAQPVVSTPNVCCGLTVGSSFSTSVTVQAESTGAAPTGTVSFFANGSPISGTVTYQQTPGSASTLTASLTANFVSSSSVFSTAGNYNITAFYSGDTNYSSAGSAAAAVKVQFPMPSINMASPGVTVASGTSVTVSAIVDTGFQNAPVPTGSVTFYYYGSSVPVPGTVSYTPSTDSNGNITLQASVSFIPPASIGIYAQFNGDSNYPAATGSGLENITVTGTDFFLNPSVPSVSTNPGVPAILQISILGQSGFSGSVNFSATSCAGLPNESTCSFSPSSMTSPGSVNLNVNTTAPHTVSMVPHSRTEKLWACSFIVPFAALCLIDVRRRRRWPDLLTLLLFAVLILGLGCGGGTGGGSGGGGGGGGGQTDPGTPPGTYTITVTGTSGSGSSAISHSTTFTLVVQ